MGRAKGHILAFITIIIWGTTFISTKVLLKAFSPVEIMLMRFITAFVVLCIAYPKRLKLTQRKQELVFAGAGLCGVTLYSLMENYAINFTLASNVAVIVSIAPFFTAIIMMLFGENKKKPKLTFFIGFVAAIAGIAVISFAGSDSVTLNLLGDGLAMGAAFIWAVYSLLTTKIGSYGYNIVQSTRRIFMYAVLFMIPVSLIFGVSPDLTLLKEPKYILNILFLGIVASAICFAVWNTAVKILGAVRASVYIYLVPIVTAVTSALILHEKITLSLCIGVALTIFGLIISNK